MLKHISVFHSMATSCAP